MIFLMFSRLHELTIRQINMYKEKKKLITIGKTLIQIHIMQVHNASIIQ